ncbi:MAG: hypothetical protein VXZ82_21250 [Planctomycetota bacterium]|nr:hypothetical protein [Planctomycetota bacterium]
MPMIYPEVTEALTGIKTRIEACFEGVQLVACEKVSNAKLSKIPFVKEGPVSTGHLDFIGSIEQVLVRIVEAVAARFDPANRLSNGSA